MLDGWAYIKSDIYLIIQIICIIIIVAARKLRADIYKAAVATMSVEIIDVCLTFYCYGKFSNMTE